VKHFLSKFFVLLFLALIFNVSGQDIPPLKIEEDGLPAKPPLSVQQAHSVYDYAKMLSPEERRMLETKISKYYDSTSTQIVIATVNKVNDDISLYATEWAHKWGIGQKEKGNGIFILIAKDNRKITIRTGYGVEHLLTDALTRRIIENDIIPYFKNGKYYEGLSLAVDAIIKVMAGEYKNEEDIIREKSNLENLVWGFIILIFLIIFLSLFFKGLDSGSGGGSGSGGSWRSSGPIIFTGSGSNSWGGSSGGGSWGGGFSGGFGGGGFGGGGATGSW